MQLTSLIFDLLQTHDCVIVPGLGAFLGQNKSAEVYADGTFIPPKRVLSFNARLSNSDGLLIHALSSNHNIEYTKAQKEVENFVQTAIALLNQNEAVHFDKIGMLNFDEAGNLQFYPFNEQDLFSHFFGLKSFSAQAVEREVIYKEPIEKNIIDTPAKKQRKIAAIVKYAAAALLILSLVISGVIGVFIHNKNIKETHTASFAPATTEIAQDNLNEINAPIAENGDTESAATVDENELTEINTQDNEKEENEIAAYSPTFEHGYYVVVGAFAKQKNVDLLYAQLKSELGNETYVTTFPRKELIAVGFFASENFKEANEVLARAKEKEATAWLLKM